MIIKLEYYLVRCQELALWKDPKSSLVALAGIHLAFGYVATTSNTVLNLTLWALLSGKYHVDIVNWREIFLTCAIFHLFLCTYSSFKPCVINLIGFVYTTWTQRIWPEIRVPEENEGDPQSSWTPVSPGMATNYKIACLFMT